MRYRIAAAMLAALAAFGLIGVLSLSSRAVEREGFTVSVDQPFEGTFPAMGPGAATSPRGSGVIGLANRPIDCSPAARTYCDTIPMEVILPAERAELDLYFLIIELSFDPGPGNTNDLDIQVWSTGEGDAVSAGLARSTNNPEILRIGNPEAVQYAITVENFSGVNTGYTIKARISSEPFVPPFEALAPEPPSAEPDGPSEPELQAPDDFSGAPATPTDLSEPDPTLAPIFSGGGGDDDFDFGFSDLDERITINTDDLGGQDVAGGAGPNAPDPVSPAVLLASLVGAPMVLVGSGVAVAWRRRRGLVF